MSMETLLKIREMGKEVKIIFPATISTPTATRP